MWTYSFISKESAESWTEHITSRESLLFLQNGSTDNAWKLYNEAGIIKKKI